MPENDEKNTRENIESPNKKTAQKTENQRDKTGRFVTGGPGGPGRGKKSNDDLQLAEDLLELVESVAREGITVSQDLKDKLNAAKLGLKVAAMKKPDGEPDPLHPVIIGLLGLIESHAQPDESGWDVIRRMIEVCPGCDKLCSKRIDVDLGLGEHQ